MRRKFFVGLIVLAAFMVGKNGTAEPVVLQPMGGTILHWTCFTKVSE